MKPATAGEVDGALRQKQYPGAPPQLLAEAVDRIAAELAPAGHVVPKQDVRNAMDVLRRHRHFDHLHLLGSAWHDTRGCDPLIQRLLAQAAVELGALDRADALLDEADAAARARPGDLEFAREAADYRGLRGRIRKQRFVASDDIRFLAEAVDCYRQQLGARPSGLLGVNVLALRTRLHGFGLDDASPPLAVLADEVLRQALDAARAEPSDPWPLATASEACLALDRLDPGKDWCDRAELWLYRFIGHPQAGPFEVESYHRQVRELWKGNPLDAIGCPGRLARIFERHVLHTQQRWAVDPRQLQRLRDDPSELEKNFSGEKAFTMDDLRRMLALASNIGCVTSHKDVRMGTGFLMPGAVFGRPDALLFVTNAHVISDSVPRALPWQAARVVFEVEAGSGAPPALVEEVLFTSEPGRLGNPDDAPGKLDVTVCRLSRAPRDAAGLSPADAVPLPSPSTKAFVVGHPQAGELQFSLQDSVLMDVCVHERLLHYRTPTDPGSSGSPVFNQDWEVVALHHAGSQTCPRLAGNGSYEANEGITLQSIRHAMG